MELERQENILIIGHQAVLRAICTRLLYIYYTYLHFFKQIFLDAYFLNMPLHQLPYIHIPLHTVIELTPRGI